MAEIRSILTKQLVLKVKIRYRQRFSDVEVTYQVYIVYLGKNHIPDEKLTSESHINLLLNVFSSEEDAKQSVLYSYRYSFSGFAAKLDATQANTLAEVEGVVSVFRSRILEVHTSRSWDFMGLTLNNNGRASSPIQLAYGVDVIVGVLDTGIWPESESFRESPGMGAIPSSWKGACDQGEITIPPITCNRKLIGARYYYTGYEQTVQPIDPSFEYKSPRDKIGHGTHTASTSVGAVVRNASFYGIGQGTIRGGAPRARLAVYKTCWNLTNSGKCCEADILAAFDQALKDGVHIISASFGAPPPLGVFFNSSMDIGSFHAMQMGVTVVFAGGNDDSVNPSLVQNVNPWSISVAASSFDRTYPTEMALSATEENFTIMGESLLTTEISGFLVAATTHFVDGICDRKLNVDYSKKANRRVILCFSSMGPTSIGTAIDAVQNASGKGMIFVEALGRQIPEVEVVPTVRVDLQQGTRLRQYIGTTFNRPRIRITPSKGVLGRSPAPEVAYFSSRGPSSLSPDILKPDITAPGVNVLAAWPSNLSPSLSDSDDRRTHWNIQSGTSMACPHVTGVVALLKSVHPTWSPAAIKSALMTTAYNKDTASEGILSGGTTKSSDPFDVGAGHINPVQAMDPGLVYDMKTSDYIIFLCNMGYSQKHIQLIVLNGTSTTCPQPPVSTSNLNYPAITVSNLQSTTTLKRTVRNVGQNRNAAYFPRVVNPEGVNMYVWPRVLLFSWIKSEVTYYVTLSPRKRSQGRYDFGEIVWSDGFHSVRSPVIVCVNNSAAFGATDF